MFESFARDVRAVILAAAAVCLLAAAPAAAAERTIDDFVGVWVGEGTTDGDGTRPDRAGEVIVTKTDAGFEVKWTTLISRSPDESEFRVRTDTLRFVKDGDAGAYKAVEAVDPVANRGEAMAWARLKGDTLAVTTITLFADGGYSIASYERTIVADGRMELTFTRFTNGEIRRLVRGAFTREAMAAE